MDLHVNNDQYWSREPRVSCHTRKNEGGGFKEVLTLITAVDELSQLVVIMSLNCNCWLIAGYYWQRASHPGH